MENEILRELSLRTKAGKDTVIEELPTKKSGRPLILGETHDKQVQEYLMSLRSNGAVINTSVAIACAMGVVKNYDSNLLTVTFLSAMVGTSY